MTPRHANLIGNDLRRWTFPEEDRHLYTTAPWQGGFRWFRSPNVIPIEQWHRPAQQRTTPPTPSAAA
jgi:hypothetical protein